MSENIKDYRSPEEIRESTLVELRKTRADIKNMINNPGINTKIDQSIYGTNETKELNKRLECVKQKIKELETAQGKIISNT